MSEQKHEMEFKNLLNRNSRVIKTVCLRFSDGNDFFFDELHQECVLAIWQEFSKFGFQRFRCDSAESTWIRGICYHAAMHYICDPKHQELYTLIDMTVVVEDGVERDDWPLIDEIKEQINNQERDMLDHYLDEDTYSAMASAEGISEAGVRKRMSRLLNKLRILFNK